MKCCQTRAFDKTQSLLNVFSSILFIYFLFLSFFFAFFILGCWFFSLSLLHFLFSKSSFCYFIWDISSFYFLLDLLLSRSKMMRKKNKASAFLCVKVNCKAKCQRTRNERRKCVTFLLQRNFSWRIEMIRNEANIRNIICFMQFYVWKYVRNRMKK